VALYGLILLIFIVCYGRMLISIRRQARVMAGHGPSGTSAQTTAAKSHSDQIQSNIIKTMIIVCSFYAVAWLPENVYYLLVNLDVQLTFLECLRLGPYYYCNRVSEPQIHAVSIIL